MSALDNVAAMPARNQRRINIKVTPKHGNPFVDCEPMELDWQLGEEIRWDCGGKPFKITFEGGSPFAESQFDEKHPDSGPVTQQFRRQYKYSIEVNGKVTDPTVIIEP